MSLHDELMATFGAPSLMDHFADEAVVTVVLGNETVVDQVNAILRPKQGFEEVRSDGTEIKRLAMEVDLLIDESEVIGLKQDYTKAHVIVDSDCGQLSKSIHGQRTCSGFN